MDISTLLGAQHLNSAYVPFSSASPKEGLASQESGAFDEILKRAQDIKASQEGASSESTLPKRVEIDKTDKLYELCMELETFLIKNLLKSMRSTVQKSNLIDTGFAGEMYEDMLYDEYAKEFTKSANFGFAEMAYRDLSGQRSVYRS